ncbi:TIGR03086 family protein [Mycolicibacterium chitae]|uniref:TIGR03086 family protein n=1 Tax=Mycolicibacterium chitae TaxID=1792 RepID=A0A3S4RTN2_MYCCI|nr:TIGR03086 family metal-binding protein [Mycolicibacterium chitae]MCV7105177.1 TIGR03086 family protein [Mycolicibacterium chitae]BBZ04965.1 TIGR03086 family protein [Mycolicibacterium chitae]VEG48587.1 TIGR03086 family protein [Mycolicibacterium chitae]
MHIDVDLRTFHRTAVQTSADLVAAVTVEDLGRASPCGAWSLGELLIHMTAQHRGFAAAAQGRGADPEAWDPAAVTDAVMRDPAGAYAATAAEVMRAFAAEEALAATFTIPEFGPGAQVPGAQAIGFHLVDYVVHGWDVARSLDRPYVIADDVVRATLPIALAVPDGDFRDADGSPFGRAVAVSEPASDLDRLLSHLGRSPAWPGR